MPTIERLKRPSAFTTSARMPIVCGKKCRPIRRMQHPKHLRLNPHKPSPLKQNLLLIGDIKGEPDSSSLLMKLGAPVFDEKGRIRPDVRFATLAALLWQQETNTASDAAQTDIFHIGAYYKFNSGLRPSDKGQEPISCRKRSEFACYMVFNGILKDKRPAGGNVLTQAVLNALLATAPEPAEPLLVYGEACRLGEERLRQAHVRFKNIPYDV